MAIFIEAFVFYIALKEFNKNRGNSGYFEAIQKVSVEFNDEVYTEQMKSVIALIVKNIKQSFVGVSLIFLEAESRKFSL